MHTAAVIILCFAATPAVGFLLGGYTALLSQGETELQRFREKVAEARKEGRLAAYFTARQGSLRLTDIIKHWRTRREARRSIWLGLFFGLIALIAAALL